MITRPYTSSKRIDAVQSPIIPTVAELIRSNPGTISLGQGVAYYGPPPAALEKIQEFTADPANHRYGPVRGIPELQQALIDKLHAVNGIWVNEANPVVVTAGSNMGFHSVLLSMTEPGDEVILPTPYFFNHEMAIRMADCYPVLVPTDDDYQLQHNLIEDAITDSTRAIVTVSPNNPTGAVYPQASLTRINQLCRKYGLYHISDEAYEDFTYENAQHFSPGSISGADEHTVSLYSLSKGFGFASWRIGYMVLPEHLLSAMLKIQDTVLICPPIVSQFAAVGALEAGREYSETMIEPLHETRRMILNELKALDGRITVPRPDGAFYVLIRVHGEHRDMDLVERLIREFGVAVIPGSAFGIDEGCYLRIAYGALQQDTAAEGIGRLLKGLNAIL